MNTSLKVKRKGWERNNPSDAVASKWRVSPGSEQWGTRAIMEEKTMAKAAERKMRFEFEKTAADEKGAAQILMQILAGNDPVAYARRAMERFGKGRGQSSVAFGDSSFQKEP